MSLPFVPLRVHSHYSRLGGPHSPADWCAYASKQEYTAIGIAERAPLASFPEFARAAREEGIALLFGVELDLRLTVPDARKPEQITHPTILFARSNEGLSNLARLSELAYADWPADESPVEWEAVLKHTEGLLIVLLPTLEDGTAPLGSVQPKKLSELGASLHEAFDGAAFMGIPAPSPLGDDTPTRQASSTLR